MDHDTLNTASTYLNNLLLARGLLRDSKPLDFAKPTRETRAQIINLVHDLLLRRDRDQENREQIALTLRTLRTDQTRKDGDLERLQTRLDAQERSLQQAQTEARNAKIEMRKLESTTKALNDQLGRLKASVSQIKTQCANDVRKRDMHIERLKSHLQGQQRGNKGGLVAPTISVGGRGPHSFNASVRDISDPEYNLKQETTDFLTQLSSGLSDENDALIEMIRGTLATLRELLGVPEQKLDNTVDGIENEDGFAHGSLAEELESMLDTLKTVLTNPNFVSMDEVEARDDEIARLREGWDQMEARWRDLLLMMNGWCTRLEKSGDTINLDELKKGLGLGVGLEAPPTAQKLRTSQHASSNSDHDSGIHTLSPTPSESHAVPPSTAKSQRSIDPPEFFNLNPRGQRTLNKMSHNVQSPRKVAFAMDASENTDPAESATGTLDTPLFVKAPATRSSLPTRRQLDLTPSAGSHDRLPSQSRGSSPPRRPVDSPSEHLPQGEDEEYREEDGSRMSVEEKLRLAQVEAEAAGGAPTKGPDEDSQIDIDLDEEMNKLRSPAKKTKIQGRPKRRKSTLSPEELEDLLGLE
ncbi:hypothetical protein E4T50_14173 [Aureobasidium sp. EXF-12298]|nr:hypothetical protein E4T50_14173 [Aureobasidium sp. EXF-12298]KAI4752612.1 hypothetical protein E4T51_14229 [Aureobasidium sp. EXF-12344]KAI4769757.1 hypothetical protein E4T52_15205 [Aureobasidium sp. EXF-3400]